jgi:hypothetical protein
VRVRQMGVCGGKYIDVCVCHSSVYNCKLFRCSKIERKQKQKIKEEENRSTKGKMKQKLDKRKRIYVSMYCHFQNVLIYIIQQTP